MKFRYLVAVLCVCPTLAQAVIYKGVDADGHVTYSSTPIKGGKKIILEPLPTMAPPGRPGATTSPEGFPKVNGETQKARDDARRKILEDELATEEKLLEEARQNLKEGEEKPEVFKTVVGHTPDGKPIMGTRRNVAKYEEKIKNLTEQIDLHQRNIEALKSELSKFKQPGKQQQ
jgi:Domain of unknown function (DUF4124)